MIAGARRLSARATIVLVLAGPALVTLGTAALLLRPSLNQSDSAALDRCEADLRAEFSRLLEQAATVAADALASSTAQAFAAGAPGALGPRLEGIALFDRDLVFLDWDGLPAEPPADLADPLAPAWRILVEGVRTRLLARAGPDGQGRFALASFVIDSTLEDLEFVDLLPARLRGPLRIEVEFEDGGAASGRLTRLSAPTGELLGTARLLEIPAAHRRAQLVDGARATAAVVLVLALLLLLRWGPLCETTAGCGLALAAIAGSRALLLQLDVTARLLARELGAPGLFGSTAARGLLASPGDLLLTAIALYLAVRALRRRCTTLAPQHGRAALAIALTTAICASAVGVALALSLARNTGLPLLERPAPFVWDGRLALWVGLLVVLLGSAGAWGFVFSRIRRSARAARLERIGTVLSLVALVVLAETLLERESERLAFEQLTHEYAPQVLEQESRRRVALVAALHEIADDDRLADDLARGGERQRQFLAYRAWVGSELFHARYKSSIDVYGPDGDHLSHFGFDLPPLAERVLAGAVLPGAGPAIVEELFQVGIADERHVLHAEVEVIADGATVAVVVGHVLDEPDNLPFLPATEPYLAALGPGALPSGGGLLAGGPHYVLYDAYDSVVLTTMRRTPAAAEIRPHATDGADVALTLGEERYRGRAFDDAGWLHLLLVPGRGPLERLATLVRLALFALALVAAFAGGAALVRTGLSAHPLALLRASFYRKLVAAVLCASVPPLIGLALFLSAYIEGRSRAELDEAGRQYVAAARQVVSDFSAQADEPEPGAAPLNDSLLHWLRAVVGQQIHVYRGGLLQASSKRELFASGLLPPRLDGGVRRRLLAQGLPSVVEPVALGPTTVPVAYATVRAAIETDADLVVAVPLVVEKEEIANEAARVAEMILIATVLLVALLAAAAALLARTVARPVRDLVAATSRIAAGRYSTRLEPRTRDEVAELVRGFNAMASALGLQRADLERRRDYIETLLRHATIGVVSLDPAGRVVTLNPAAAHLLGAGPGLAEPGTRLAQALAGRDELRPLVAVLDSGPGRPDGEPVDVDLPGEGSARRLRVVRVELRGAAGDRVGTMILLDDVTDLMRSNQLAAWAEMARAIAHEIKNPLTPIQLSTGHLRRLLRDRGVLPTAEEEECLGTIMKQVRALYEIAGEFSAYAKLPDLALAPTDPAALVREVIAPYRAAPPAGVRIEERYRPAAAIRADRRVLSRALVNLVENALQAMEQGGTLVLEVGAGQGGTVELHVADTGRGLDPAVRQRLFEPYFSTKSSGTGLGLAIVKRAVEAHGGEILVGGSPGAGTVFTIRLPAASAAD